MTIIKTFTEKKPVLDKDPLVANAVNPSHDVEAASEREDTPPPSGADPRLLMMRVRAQRVSTITTMLLIATSTLVLAIGICGGFYIYQQFIKERQPRFKAYYNIPYSEDESNALAQQQYASRAQFSSLDEHMDSISLEAVMNNAQKIMQTLDSMNKPNSVMLDDRAMVIPEEIEMDGSGMLEKVHVPEFKHGRNSKFIHDFRVNMTAIIDLNNKKCFVMPLDRNRVLPPASLLDLISKIMSGYYNVAGRIKETCRAVEPSLEDLDSLGPHISAECQDYPVYKLEKFVGGIFKRSIEDEASNKAFTVLDGVQTRAIEIVNLDKLEPTAVAKK